VRQLDSGLRPANRNPDPALCPYNLSGGISLADAPVVAVALRLLRWLTEPVHHSEVESLLRSPFFELEAFAAQSQNGNLPESYDAVEFAHRFGITPLRAIVGMATSRNVALAEQILQIRNALELAGWPNASKLTSEVSGLSRISGFARRIGRGERHRRPLTLQDSQPHKRRTAFFRPRLNAIKCSAIWKPCTCDLRTYGLWGCRT
jgi:hypothetical protein